MDLYSSFLLLIFGLLAVSRPSASQVGARPGGMDPVKPSPLELKPEPLGKIVKGKPSFRKNKNEGMSETDPLIGPSTSNAFFREDPFKIAEVKNHYVSNSEVKDSAHIEEKNQSVLKKLFKWNSFLSKKEESKKNSEPIDDWKEIHTDFYTKASIPVPCIFKYRQTRNDHEYSLRLTGGAEKEYGGLKRLTLYTRKNRQGIQKIFGAGKPNKPGKDLKKRMRDVEGKLESIAEKNEDVEVRFELVENSSETRDAETLEKMEESGLNRLEEIFALMSRPRLENPVPDSRAP